MRRVCVVTTVSRSRMKVLFICTHNRCRSILFEAITRQRAGGLIDARSAGSQPSGEVHPLTLKYLSAAGYSIANLQSQSWDAFADWSPQVAITVCDRAAGEACPLYLGTAIKCHWGLADPSATRGSDQAIRSAFAATIATIEARVDGLMDVAQAPGADWPARLAALTEEN